MSYLGFYFYPVDDGKIHRLIRSCQKKTETILRESLTIIIWKDNECIFITKHLFGFHFYLHFESRFSLGKLCILLYLLLDLKRLWIPILSGISFGIERNPNIKWAYFHNSSECKKKNSTNSSLCSFV